MPTYTPEHIAAVLTAEGLPCEPHQLGLAAYTSDPAAYARALKACDPVILRVLTTDDPVPLPDPCDGTYLCDCQACRDQRADLLKRRPVRQPWEVRRAA